MAVRTRDTRPGAAPSPGQAPVRPVAPQELDRARARARDHLLGLQSEDGWWRGELQTNVTMDAEDLLLREFLGARDERATELAARWIRSQQREDGSWTKFYGGPGDLSTTIEAYVALRLAGDNIDAEHLARARGFILGRGGLESARVFTHIWLALFGLWPWEQVPALPPEMIFLPRWFPLNPYDFACWARQTVVALTVVRSLRPARPLGLGVDELRSGRPPIKRRAPTWRGRLLAWLDAALRLYERRPLGWLRRRALDRVEDWIVERQEEDGSWGGIQPPWVYSLIALSLRGHSLEHPVMRRGLGGIEGFLIQDELGRRLEACQSPVWDTALAVTALTDAGLVPDHPALVRAADWLLGEEVRVRGDWAVRRPGLPAGGWAFEFANQHYPDTDDTAEVVLALRRVRHPAPVRVHGAVARAVAWAQGMQSSDGGWGAFDADNARRLVRELPFCDFGEVIDDPSADVCAHMLEMLAVEGRAGTPPARRGAAWLLEAQEPDGSWFGRWGVNYVYGTGAVLPALRAHGVPATDPRLRRAGWWLESVQNADGGWGEDPRSYDDRAWAGRGQSTASQTAWALLGLHALGERTPAVERGLRWLIEHQREDGTWDEPWYTGTGFPGDYYINYHLYRLLFPLSALGRWGSAT
ncbi:MAG: squalene--hopene cyclase [Actinobacteria bacterium]|nr:MAG: squalene--hopene cyclase [Actinomycetota bacterium]